MWTSRVHEWMRATHAVQIDFKKALNQNYEVFTNQIRYTFGGAILVRFLQKLLKSHFTSVVCVPCNATNNDNSKWIVTKWAESLLLLAECYQRVEFLMLWWTTWQCNCLKSEMIDLYFSCSNVGALVSILAMPLSLPQQPMQIGWWHMDTQIQTKHLQITIQTIGPKDIIWGARWNLLIVWTESNFSDLHRSSEGVETNVRILCPSLGLFLQSHFCKHKKQSRE